MDDREQKRMKDSLLNKMRQKCMTKSIGALKQLGCIFRKMDTDFSKRINFQELKQGVHVYGLDMTDEELKVLFDAFDRDHNQMIDFNEFIVALRPPMAKSRLKVIDEAFNKLDVNNDDVIDVGDLKITYSTNAKNHPRYKSGEWSEEQTLRFFLDSLDTPGDPDGKVTRNEFHNYYAGVSSTVDDDCFFDFMMRACFGLQQKGKPAQSEASLPSSSLHRDSSRGAPT